MRLLQNGIFAKLTGYMEQSSSSGANIHSGSQEIPRLLWDPKLPYDYTSA
jgi:hypothetical protein